MTPSSKAKVLTDAVLKQMRAARHLLDFPAPDIVEQLLDHIDALKADVDDLTETNQDLRQSRDILEAELALKDKVVEAARLWKTGRDHWLGRNSPPGAGPYIKGEHALIFALNDLDKVMAR